MDDREKFAAITAVPLVIVVVAVLAWAWISTHPDQDAKHEVGGTGRFGEVHVDSASHIGYEVQVDTLFTDSELSQGSSAVLWVYSDSVKFVGDARFEDSAEFEGPVVFDSTVVFRGDVVFANPGAEVTYARPAVCAYD